jgi:hypothetical protein
MWKHETARHAASNEAASPSSNRRENPRLRCDGWTPDKQREFCEILAECGAVQTAAEEVGMTRQTAYRLRCRKPGRAFALAWDAAMLIASQAMIGQAVELALNGSIETVTRDDKNTITKTRQTPAMLFSVVERLRSPKILGTPDVIAASQDWDTCLDLLEQGIVYVAGMEVADDAQAADEPDSEPAENVTAFDQPMIGWNGQQPEPRVPEQRPDQPNQPVEEDDPLRPHT